MIDRFKKFLYIFSPILVSTIFSFLLISVVKSIEYKINFDMDIVILNFTLFGFSLTAFSMVIGFMHDSFKIKKIMEKWHIKQVILCEISMLISSIISVISKIFFLNNLLMITLVFSLVGTSYFLYFMIILSVNSFQDSIKK